MVKLVARVQISAISSAEISSLSPRALRPPASSDNCSDAPRNTDIVFCLPVCATVAQTLPATVMLSSDGTATLSGPLLAKSQPPAAPWFKGRARGYILSLAAVLAVSPDAMLLRYIRRASPTCGLEHRGGGSAHADCVVPTIALIMTIKYAIMGSIQLGFVVWEVGGVGQLAVKARRGWWALFTPTVFMMITQIGFTVGLLETTAANAIMFFSLNPMWAAMMGLVFLGDRVEKHTVVAMVIAAACVALAFVPSIFFGDDEADASAEGPEGGSKPTLHGNLFALATGASLAAFITGSRAGSQMEPEAPMGAAPALGSLGASALALPLALASLPRFDAPVITLPFLAWIAADGVLEAFYDLWMGQAAEDITSAEVALVLLLEIPLGPLYVFFAFDELPPMYTIAGCVVLLVTLVGHGVHAAKIAARSRDASTRTSLQSSLQASPKAETKLTYQTSPSLGAVRRSLSWSDDLGNSILRPSSSGSASPSSGA